MPRIPPTNLRDLLIADEEVRIYAYPDQFGYLSIGVGRMIDERRKGGLSLKEVFMMLDNDIVDKVQGPLLKTFPWTSKLTEPRYAVIASMAFNIGMKGLKEFTQFLAACENGIYDTAAAHMRDSLWYRQVPARAERLAVQMETNVWQ
jgi:lysozyme